MLLPAPKAINFVVWPRVCEIDENLEIQAMRLLKPLDRAYMLEVGVVSGRAKLFCGHLVWQRHLDEAEAEARCD